MKILFSLVLLCVVLLITCSWAIRKQNKHYPPQTIIHGKEVAEASSIVICGLARNLKPSQLVAKKKELEQIGNLFGDYKIVIVENNSVDDTRTRLLRWQIENHRVVILTPENDKGIVHDRTNLKTWNHENSMPRGWFERIHRMAHLRETYLEYVKLNCSKSTFMLVVDMDIVGETNTDGLMLTLLDDDWSAVFVNGRVISSLLSFPFVLNPYDNIAFIPLTGPIKDRDLRQKALNKSVHTPENYTDVKSAFNGYAIYKIDDLSNSSYISNENDICEHITLHSTLPRKKRISTRWTGLFYSH
jgi:hypothetical protein